VKRILAFAIAVAACSGRSDRADSVDAALPAVDTIKAVVASDTAIVASDSGASRTSTPVTSTKTKATTAPTGTRGARDSAFPPPRNLPKLDTVGAKKPPV
jgi:hypothetical protein